MAQIKLAEIRPSGTIEGKVDALYDAFFMMRKQMMYYLSGALDSENIHSITTDQLIAGDAKIGTALIEDLEVGSNVTMGANATISWGQVTGTGDIPLRTDLVWDNIGEKPTDLLTQSELTSALTDYVTGGEMSSALANTLNTGNFDTIITKDYIASMNLVVGDEISMGANATISWNKVDSKPAFSTVATSGSYGDLSNKPSIPSQYTNAMALAAWANSDYATYIDADGVYSGSFNGGMFNVNPTGSSSLPSGITIGGYYESSWIGQALQIKYEPGGDGGFPGTVFNSSGDVPVVFDLETIFESYVRFRSSSDVDFQGSVDFTGATVTGLSSTYKFG